MTGAGIEKSKPDGRRLLLPEASMSRAIKAVPSGRKSVLATHHPLDWLTDFCESDLLDTLDGNIIMHLFGHMHEVRPTAVAALRGTRVVHQSGALYTGRGRYNGYGLVRIDLDTGHTAIHLRSYFDRRREFDAGIDIAKGGIFFSSPDAEAFWHAKNRQVDRDALRGWIRGTLLPAARQCWNEGIIDRPVGDVFVPPPMYTRRIVRESTDESLPETDEVLITLDGVVSNQENIIFHGRQEYGKTTLIHQIALELIRRSVLSDFLTVPILIDFLDLKRGHDRVLRLLNSGLPAPLENVTLRQLLEEGLVTILVDDVILSDSYRHSLLQTFIRQFPKNRFIYTALLDAPNRLVTASDEVVIGTDTSVSFSHVFLKPFTRSKMRSLVEKWNTSGRRDQEIILDRITEEIAGINIPVTAVNGTILLIIYESESTFKPINRAALIERFVEHLLEKRSLTDAQRGTFDFTNKVHVLAYLAEHMAQTDNYVLSRQETCTVVREYLSAVGLVQDPDELVTTFVSSRVLATRSDDRLSFRYRAFLEYFIACQMRFKADFKSWVLEESRYLSYINEIQHFAGIARDDAELLSLVGARFTTLFDDVIQQMGWSPDLSLLEKFRVPGDDTKADLWTEFERQMQAPPLNAEERDEELEADLPQDVEERQEVFRPQMESIAHQWVTALLLYSGLLKNMEIIPDQTKREHLKKILSGWSLLTVQSLWSVPLLAKHRKIKINGMYYEVLLPRHYSEARVARTIYLELPNSIGHLLKTMLGTEKLERQLVEPSLDEAREPAIITYYRHSLIADLRLGDWCSSLNSLYEQLRTIPYLKEALLRKVGNIYSLGFDLRDGEARLRGLAGKIIGDLRGKNRAERYKLATEGVEHLKRQDLVRRLRLIAAERSSNHD